jgi:spectinomycin phosphotransferase
MLVKQLLSDQRIIDCLNIDYGIEVVALTFLPLGADRNASVYKVEAQDKSSYFVKLKRGHHHDISIAIMGLLHNVGIQQIIPPIKTTHSQPSRHIDDFTLVVYPFVEGQNGFNRPLTDKQWLTLGKALRQVHEIGTLSSIQLQLRREAYSPKWREIVRSLYTSIVAESIYGEMGLKLWAFMQENKRVIHQLVDRAEQLAQKLQDESPKFVLCHSDIHGGNVLLDGNNTIYIVDWDEPIMAPKERDLMFIGGGVGNVWNKPHEETFFYKGYGKSDVNMTILAYYRHERIVEDIAFLGQDLLLTTAGGGDRSEMYRHFIDMFEPRGVVDIALRTDESLPKLGRNKGV